MLPFSNGHLLQNHIESQGSPRTFYPSSPVCQTLCLPQLFGNFTPLLQGCFAHPDGQPSAVSPDGRKKEEAIEPFSVSCIRKLIGIKRCNSSITPYITTRQLPLSGRESVGGAEELNPRPSQADLFASKPPSSFPIRLRFPLTFPERTLWTHLSARLPFTGSGKARVSGISLLN